MRELEGRIALITGASRGIGAATARAMAAAGARVILSDIIDVKPLAHELGGIACHLDVTDESSWVAAMALARAEAGGLDILVNNAGLFMVKATVDTSLEDWRRLHAVNVDGVFLGCKHALPLIAERAAMWDGGGAIINLSSVAGLRGSGLAACYNSTKGAVRLFTKGLAMEVAPLGIRVNSIHPGIMATDMADDLVTRFADAMGADPAVVQPTLEARHALGKFGEARHVADAAVYLASSRAAFMTGSELVVDGGFSAH